MSRCPTCGSQVPAAARFCPECGHAVPTGETGEHVRRSSYRNPFLIIVGALVAAAVILLVAGAWAWGLVVLLGAGIVLLSQREAERRAARYAVLAVLSRLSARRVTWTARSRGQLEIFRARRELVELEAERSGALHVLGRVVFEEDESGIGEAKAAVAAVVERIRAKEAEIQTLIRQTEERVQRAQAAVTPTEKLEAPPEPARVPEPWPPPDEGDPPAPAPVPEPSPGDPPPDPEHPPAPQTSAERKR